MNIASHPHKVRLVLKPHQVLTLHTGRERVTIDCQDGLLWVTNSAERRDLMLRRGRRYIPGAAGDVVIEAIRDATVDIEER